MCKLVERSVNSDAPDHEVKTNFQYKNPGKSTFAQVLATIMKNFLLIEIGLERVMPTIVLGSLHKNPAEPLNMNDDQASWFGSIPDFCHPVGSLLSGFLQEQLGRKGAMMVLSIPIFVGWMIMYFAQSIHALYAVSVIMGLCTGLSEAPLNAYIGVGAMSLFGYLFDWRTVALIPESPTWLIVRGRLDEARKSLCWLRGWVSPSEVEPEFQSLVNYISNSAGPSREQNLAKSTLQLKVEPDEPAANSDGFLKRELKELTNKKMLRPLQFMFIMFFIVNIANVSGIGPYFIGELKMLESPIDPNLVFMIVSGLFFVGTMVNVVFLRRFGKRKIALLSQTLAGVCILSLGLYATCLQGLTQYPLRVWIPLILWFIFHFLNGFSIITTPWQLICEVFPPMGRGTATGIAAAWSHFVMSVLVKTYLYTEAWIGFSGVMYLYGIGTMAGVIYYYFYLPETEGKTLEQIESYFTKNHDKREKFSIAKPPKKDTP